MVDRGALPRLTLNDAFYVWVCRFSACACACIKSTCALRKENILGLCTKIMKNEWNKWENHFYEMKRDVGMSVHEKEVKQEDAYTKTQTQS